MQVYLIHPRDFVPKSSLHEHSLRAYSQFVEDARHDRHKVHTVCDTLGRADIVFAPVNDDIYGPFFERLRALKRRSLVSTPLLIYSPLDNQCPGLPGLYPSVSRLWQRLGLAAPAHYRSSHFPNFAFDWQELAHKDLLCSFVGSARTHPIRQRLMALPLQNSVMEDVSANSWWWDQSLAKQAPIVDAYRGILRRSTFVLCPRGVSPSSIRLYEAMEAAAVPVILADDIVLPEGPDWPAFSIQLPQGQLHRIPEVLDQHRSKALQMGRLARQTWEQYFAPHTSFHSMIEWSIALLQRSRARMELANWLAIGSSYVELRHVRTRLRKVIR
jgi:hypothetical protein